MKHPEPKLGQLTEILRTKILGPFNPSNNKPNQVFGPTNHLV